MPSPSSLRLLAALSVVLAAACARPATTAPARGPAPVSRPAQSGEPAAAERPLSAEVEYLRARQLVVPVAGASSSRIRDSFADARDGGARTHRAIDILAPRGTPVLSADEGIVLRLSTNTLGGITVYATDPSERIVYYYAHLDGYRPGLAQGSLLAKGDTIGFVGTTGNAPENVPHLHFQVMRMPSDRLQYWNGEPINPFPLLREAATRVSRAQ
jgi:peptidoglycan LD-endopeptidase LytH